LVELYDHECPHCWYAVPLVTDVVSSYRGVHDLRTAALNCHMDINADFCYALGIVAGSQTYPTLLLCSPGEHDDPPLSAHAQDTLKHVQPYFGELIKQLGRCNKHFDKDEGSLLDAVKIADWIQATTGLGPSHIDALSRGADFVDYDGATIHGPPGVPGWMGDDMKDQPGVPAWTPAQRHSDALRGFVSALYHSYDASTHGAAVKVTEFLALAFPTSRDELGELASKLRASGAFYDRSALRSELKSFASKVGLDDATQHPDALAFVTCRGASCALWTLFHVVVSSVAGLKLSGDSRSTTGLEINVVMGFVRTMVEHFLSCDSCKKDFLADFDACAYGRCSQAEDDGAYARLPIWMWRAHNAVSMKVATIDPSANGVDRRWPMYLDCPKCWRQQVAMGTSHSRLLSGASRRIIPGTPRLSSEDLDSVFHLEYIFWFMVDTYVGLDHWPQEARTAETEMLVKIDVGDGVHRPNDLPAYPRHPLETTSSFRSSADDRSQGSTQSAWLIPALLCCCCACGYVFAKDDIQAQYRTWKLRRGLAEADEGDPLDAPVDFSETTAHAVDDDFTLDGQAVAVAAE